MKTTNLLQRMLSNPSLGLIFILSLVIVGLPTQPAVSLSYKESKTQRADTGKVNLGNWVPAGTLTAGRHDHTTTLLPDGKVLVAGGVQERITDSPALIVTELYDSVSRTWSTTNSLNSGRIYHTSTLLTDGTVLVTGGRTGYTGDALSSAEIYDSISGSWNYTSSLSMPRFGHSGTLLADGRVLVAGGRFSSGSFDVLTSAEIYDPDSKTWSITGSLITPRESHSATLLSNGKVLIVGGYNQSWLYSAEIYDPASETWSEITSPLFCHGVAHTATKMLDGRVLLVGGACGSGTPGIIAGTEFFDPVTSTWKATASLPEVREVHTATLLPNGEVLIVGGDDGDVPRYNSALIYDFLGDVWIPTDSLAIGRRNHTATLLNNGDVLVIGGWGDTTTYLDTAELYQAYNSSSGFVTGGGWIDSPAGAYVSDQSLCGKANFGFVSKYKKSASNPTGNTSFKFNLAGLEFHSYSYEWLGINSNGTVAWLKGNGTVNNGLDPNENFYKFMLWAGDGSPDTFRIKIWWEDENKGHVIYDNGLDQAIGGGSIVIHKK